MFSSYQEAFDTTMLKLEAQGGLAVDEWGNCRYNTPSGNQCAVGIHFPPHALGLVEGKSVQAFYGFPRLLEVIAVDESAVHETISFWELVQSLHDCLVSQGTNSTFRSLLRDIEAGFHVDTSLASRIENLKVPDYQFRGAPQ